MTADEVVKRLAISIEKGRDTGEAASRLLHRPRLLSDNGSSYISDDLAKWLKRHAMALPPIGG